MIKSMTAFASCEAACGIYTINCEIRSVNHRYSDIFLKIPEQLRFVEANLRTLIAAQLKRGKIECILSLKKQSVDAKQIIIDEQALHALLESLHYIDRHIKAPRPYSAIDILAFPGIQQEAELNRQQLGNEIHRLVAQALTQIIEVRSREGKQLSQIIETRCGKMRQLIVTARQRMPEVLHLLRNKLNSRITELIAEPDHDRLGQELVILAQKLDIEEELDRLDTHIEEVSKILQQDEPVGRKLDFLMQEMNREANTLGSKSADKEMTRIAIEMKVLIEQMREQIQNIE